MLEIIHPQIAPPGIARENVFIVVDDMGMKIGSATVVEYVNAMLLPERPLNYYVTLSVMDDRAFDMLMGAVTARALALRTLQPPMPARMYVPCRPDDRQLLAGLQAIGFDNDDADIRMRRYLSANDPSVGAPVGCVVAPVILEDEVDCEGLITRVNRHSVTARSLDWVRGLQEGPFFQVLGMWQEQRLLGEAVVTAYGSEGRIEAIYTAEPYLRRGVASALVARAGEILQKGGAKTITAEVWRRNTVAMDFFRSARFDSVAPVMLYPGVNWG